MALNGLDVTLSSSPNTWWTDGTSRGTVSNLSLSGGKYIGHIFFLWQAWTFQSELSFIFFFYLEPSKCISWMMEENSILLSRNQVYGRTVSGQCVKMCPLITGAVLGRVYHVDVLDIKHSCTKSSSLLISMTAVVYRYVWLRCTSVSRASTVMVEYRLLTDILYSCILL